MTIKEQLKSVKEVMLGIDTEENINNLTDYVVNYINAFRDITKDINNDIALCVHKKLTDKITSKVTNALNKAGYSVKTTAKEPKINRTALHIYATAKQLPSKEPLSIKELVKATIIINTIAFRYDLWDADMDGLLNENEITYNKRLAFLEKTNFEHIDDFDVRDEAERVAEKFYKENDITIKSINAYYLYLGAELSLSI